MLKRFMNPDGNTLCVGTTRDIRSLYKNMMKRGYYALYPHAPEFNNDKMCGLYFCAYAKYSVHEGVEVVSSDTALRMLMSGDFEKVRYFWIDNEVEIEYDDEI